MDDLKKRVEATLSMLQTYENETSNFVFGARMHDTSKLIENLTEREAKLVAGLNSVINACLYGYPRAEIKQKAEDTLKSLGINTNGDV